MADITQEIECLRNYVADLPFSRIWMQHLPAVYTAGELSIRYIGDATESETGYHYRLDRDFQFVLFGTSERDCVSRASALQRRLNGAIKLKITDAEESGYMTLGSFSCSPPFKAEDSEVYGVIGIMQAQVREARDFSALEAPKMGGITIDVKPSPPGEGGGKPSDFPEKEYEINIGNGACN